MSPNDADGMANSVDSNQTAPLGAVWSGSALFAQAYMSENLGSLQYIQYASTNESIFKSLYKHTVNRSIMVFCRQQESKPNVMYHF